jgi:hypothetical protein
MHRPFVKFAAFVCALGLATPPALTARSDNATVSAPVELEITGPRLIHRGHELRFRAFLTNRSPETIIIPAPNGMLRASTNWKTTDTAGKELPTPRWEGGYCPVTGLPSVGDSDFVFLKSGERIEIPVPGDPSDLVVFPGKGFYLVTLSYQFTPPKIWHNADGSLFYFMGISGSKMSAEWQERVLKTAPVQATSKAWSMYLVQ